MRDFSPIVAILSRVVGHGRHDTQVSSTIAPQLVRHEAPRLAFLPLQQFAEEPSGRTRIALSLNEHVDHVPILIDGPPEIVALALDVDEDFVQVPDVSQPPQSTLELSCVLGPELPAPLPDSLVGDDNPPLRQKLLDIAEAQRESVIQPDSVTNDLGRETVSVVAVRSAVHQRSLTDSSLT